MTGAASPTPERLDSWKEIAEYLRRDVGTVRRWEKTLGLPVRRVPGSRGHSVFAYASEIDGWLKAKPVESSVEEAKPRMAWRSWVAALALAGLAVGLAAAARARRPAGSLRVEVTSDAVVAFDAGGAARWRHGFAADYKTALTEVGEKARVVGGSAPAVYFATSHRERRSDGQVESGTLARLDADGRLTGSFSFDDEVTLAGKTFRAPWALTTFALNESGPTRRVAVAAHHFLWSPSLVTVIDERWQRYGTFVHQGWIEDLHWLAPDRLLAAGFSEARDGGMLALLDTTVLGKVPPLAILVMPRSEINRATVSRFNRAAVQVMPDRIVARTIEVPADVREAVDALYEFTRSFEPVKASFSARYWDVHRALEGQGKLDHTRESCPDKDGPRELLRWEPATGWRVLKLR